MPVKQTPVVEAESLGKEKLLVSECVCVCVCVCVCFMLGEKQDSGHPYKHQRGSQSLVLKAN